VFLSHAAQDRKFATRLSKLLKRHRVEVWYSRKHLHGAQQWHDEIGKALERCDWFLIVLSPEAVKSVLGQERACIRVTECAIQGPDHPRRTQEVQSGKAVVGALKF
jgi:TIR domain